MEEVVQLLKDMRAALPGSSPLLGTYTVTVVTRPARHRSRTGVTRADSGTGKGLTQSPIRLQTQSGSAPLGRPIAGSPAACPVMSGQLGSQNHSANLHSGSMGHHHPASPPPLSDEALGGRGAVERGVAEDCDDADGEFEEASFYLEQSLSTCDRVAPDLRQRSGTSDDEVH